MKQTFFIVSPYLYQYSLDSYVFLLIHTYTCIVFLQIFTCELHGILQAKCIVLSIMIMTGIPGFFTLIPIITGSLLWCVSFYRASPYTAATSHRWSAILRLENTYSLTLAWIRSTLCSTSWWVHAILLVLTFHRVNEHFLIVTMRIRALMYACVCAFSYVLLYNLLLNASAWLLSVCACVCSLDYMYMCCLIIIIFWLHCMHPSFL